MELDKKLDKKKAKHKLKNLELDYLDDYLDFKLPQVGDVNQSQDYTSKPFLSSKNKTIHASIDSTTSRNKEPKLIQDLTNLDTILHTASSAIKKQKPKLMALNSHVTQSLDFSNINLIKSNNRYRSTIDTGAALIDS